ncbi:CULT domain-containing protein [Aphelenchoides besseyi]|nr:CULT domain-containing protein [Aphelenchoides besseyi]
MRTTGLSFFSYWAALSIPINDKRKLELLRIDNVDLRLQLECQWLSRLKKLNCKCGSPKINVLHLFNFMSESLSSCFVNECYAWTIIVCKDCDAHVGWKFQAENKLPSTFYAVLRCLEIPNDFSEET